MLNVIFRRFETCKLNKCTLKPCLVKLSLNCVLPECFNDLSFFTVWAHLKDNIKIWCLVKILRDFKMALNNLKSRLLKKIWWRMHVWLMMCLYRINLMRLLIPLNGCHILTSKFIVNLTKLGIPSSQILKSTTFWWVLTQVVRGKTLSCFSAWDYLGWFTNKKLWLITQV